jgi:fumarate hydratase class II
MGKTRTESDTFGPIEVPADRYWGAQTERARHNFLIGEELMPTALIRALAIVKRAAAETNYELKLLDGKRARAIMAAAQEVIDGKLEGNFPLSIWQSGSGTQTNMNVNEVIANRANEILGGARGAKRPVHPNDHVNMSQSTNDAFPTAMHIAAAEEIAYLLDPALAYLQDALQQKIREFSSIIKIGRTHMQDATPLTLGQEFSGYAAQVRAGIVRMRLALKQLYPLAQGGTAVGTGLNTKPKFAKLFAQKVARITRLPFVSAPNKFEVMAAHDAYVFTHGALTAVATALFKIANDIRLLGSGPRSGLGELILPENEPGSSIMPGKVNPVIPEVVNQLAFEAIGNDVTVSFAAEGGQMQLNAFEPIIAHSLFEGLKHLKAGCDTLRQRCVTGITANREHLRRTVEHSIGIVTALNPYIGYARASDLAQEAHATGKSVYALVLEKGLLSRERLDEILNPKALTRPNYVPEAK